MTDEETPAVETTETPDETAGETPKRRRSAKSEPVETCPICERIRVVDEDGPCPRCGYDA